MLYSRGMIPTDLYKSILQHFTGDTSVKEKDFYTNDKFALWIDLRTHSDNNIHGSGLALRDTIDGVKLEIRRTTGGSGTITYHMFIVADALMERYSKLCFCLQYPFKWFLEIPSASSLV